MRRFILCLAACTTEVGPGAPPASGAWDYKDGGIVSSTCPDDLYRDPDATFVLTPTPGGGFTITEEEDFGCDLDGNSFSCPERRRIEVPVGDTTLAWAVRVDGTFLNTHRMEGTQTFSVTCTGGLCDLDQLLLGVDLPCSWEVAFTATAR